MNKNAQNLNDEFALLNAQGNALPQAYDQATNYDMPYELITAKGCKPVKAWVRGVSLEPEARKQLLNIASLPFVHKHIAVMPDAHLGKGSTIGSVIPTTTAVVPASVGVDIGCGMIAVATSLMASDLPDNLRQLRDAIERAVPVGNAYFHNLGGADAAFAPITSAWHGLKERFDVIATKYPKLCEKGDRIVNQLGTLGGGNHFIEILVDEAERVWLMLHSGSRGIGNLIGTHFIGLARKEMAKNNIQLPDRDLAYLSEGSQYFDDYLFAVEWAQDYAFMNRQIMMGQVQHALSLVEALPDFTAEVEVINCHHNYVARESHFGETVWVTRKGAVKAALGDWGIIPGSMGVGSYIVRGKGSPESFNSCSHGAGRAMSRTAARKNISLERHARDTAHVECRKDENIIDESPAAYKPLDDVMRAQADLIEIVHKLKPLVCVKG